MKNNQNKKKNISKIKENNKLNPQKNKIEEIKIKAKTKRDIKKILLPMKKENMKSYKKYIMKINNNTGFWNQNNFNTEANNHIINKKLIFQNNKRNPIHSSKTNYINNTEKNDINNLQKKKKLLKLSTNDEIFGFRKRKIDKGILRANNNNNENNDIEPLTKTFSFRKENSLNNNEKSWELIEKFADNFRNKERGESLKNVLNMYKRYKSLSSLSNNKKLNNSYSSITIIKNKSYYQKGENNFPNAIQSKENKEKYSEKTEQIHFSKKHMNNSNDNNKENINQINMNNEKKKKKEKSNKKYFLRKVVREEKCYIDKNGKIHVVDFKQSLIDDKDKKNPIKKTKNNKRQRSYKNKKINVEINQINNINSYNNIGDIHSIKDFKKDKKHKNSYFNQKEFNNLTERHETENLKIIGLSKRLKKNNSNFKYYENKLVNHQKKIEQNMINNNTSVDRITHRTVHSFGNNHSFYCSTNNNNDLNNNNNYAVKEYNMNMQNPNQVEYNNMNDYNYKNHYYPPYYNRRIYTQNNDNCSFYESKSFSNYKDKILKQNNKHVNFYRNNIFDINYTNNPDSEYLYDEDMNNNTFFNSYILDYSYNNYNSKQNTGKISSYRLIRIPKNKI